jgi:hypothetical protein
MRGEGNSDNLPEGGFDTAGDDIVGDVTLR